MGYAVPSPVPVMVGEERERLILEHLPQVRWIATRIHEKLPESFSLEDLVSTGVLGLIAAVDHFDPTRNVKLCTYAEHKIRGAILDSLRGLDGIPLRKRKLVRQIEAAIGRVQQRLQRLATEDEIAEEMQLPLGEYQELLLETQGVSLNSLDGFSEDSTAGFLQFLSSGQDSPAAELERSELEATLRRTLDRMPRLEREVLGLYYMEELTLREIAEIMGIQLQRVWQLRTQAVLRLRTLFQKKWPAGKGGY